MLNGLDLFSGIGGISLGLKPYVTTIAYCESDSYAQGVLLSRMQTGDIDKAPIWDDVRTLSGEMLPEVDIIFGGFPCQDISTAGNGKGLEGERSGLFFEIRRLVSELRPRFVFLENVPAISVRGLDRILLEFTSLGYDTRWTTVSAESVGACHKRRRWFMLAHSNGQPMRIEHEQEFNQSKIWPEPVSKDGHDSDTTRTRWEEKHIAKRSPEKFTRPCGYNEWTSEPALRGRNHGIQNRVDRVKCLGNSVVPLQAHVAFKRLIGMKE